MERIVHAVHCCMPSFVLCAGGSEEEGGFAGHRRRGRGCHGAGRCRLEVSGCRAHAHLALIYGTNGPDSQTILKHAAVICSQCLNMAYSVNVNFRLEFTSRSAAIFLSAQARDGSLRILNPPLESSRPSLT